MKPFGLLIVDKPVGPTSHKVVSIVRQGTGARKVGHAGTLDPRASGILVLCIGSATRLSEYLSSSDKQYEAVIQFGSSTQTYDAEGEVIRKTDSVPSEEEITAILPEFRGEIQQVPPPYSAIKIKGQKAYELARSGQDVELESRQVTIHKLEVLSYQPPDLTLMIDCTAGTYIRSIAHDLGERLGTGAHLANLRRTKAGPFMLDDCTQLSELEQSFISDEWREFLVPAKNALPDLPLIELRSDQHEEILNGRRIAAEGVAEGMARAIGPDGDLVALLEAVEDGKQWHPRKVFTR